MQIWIKTLDGRKTSFNFEPEVKIGDVKQTLAEKTGIYIEMIRLIYRGSPMVDTNTLESHKVEGGSVIHMIMQLRG